MIYTLEEYALLRDQYAFKLHVLDKPRSESNYKHYLESRMQDPGKLGKSAALWYAVFFGPFYKLPLYICDSDKDLRSVVAWRLSIGH